jgi:mono/diheme cytochrome c family protein
MKRLLTGRICVFMLVMVLSVLLTACGGDDESDARPTRTQLPFFEQVATSTESPDMPTAVATSAAADDSEATPNPTAVARGLGSWERLECASCHGENGEGGADEIDGTPAPSLLEVALSEDEFIDWLRTGGTLGNDHLFSTDRLSDNGGKNLYQYILSLSEDQ